MHRFKIEQTGPLEEKLGVTLLARETQFRNILNQDELVKEVRRRLGGEIDLRLVTYDTSTPFLTQINQTQ